MVYDDQRNGCMPLSSSVALIFASLCASSPRRISFLCVYFSIVSSSSPSNQPFPIWFSRLPLPFSSTGTSFRLPASVHTSFHPWWRACLQFFRSITATERSDGQGCRCTPACEEANVAAGGTKGSVSSSEQLYLKMSKQPTTTTTTTTKTIAKLKQRNFSLGFVSVDACTFWAE